MFRQPISVNQYGRLNFQKILRDTLEIRTEDRMIVGSLQGSGTSLPPGKELAAARVASSAPRRQLRSQTFPPFLQDGNDFRNEVGVTYFFYEPGFALNTDKTRYIYVSGTQRSLLPRPMPISMMLWSGVGEEPTLIKIASAYEAATKHRVPPPDFGPLP